MRTTLSLGSDARAVRDLTLMVTLVAILILSCALGFGYALGGSMAAADCRNLGAFMHAGKVYECKPRAR